jgi:outer membrane protein OmpA-like peptidoglycan-associated protein
MCLKNRQKRSLGLAIGVVLGLASAAHAQPVEPSVLIAGLAPGTAGPVVSALKSQDALVIDINNQIPVAFDFPSVNVTVSFDGETHLLTAQGMTALRSVAFALQDDRLINQRFQVAGHVVSEKDPNGAIRLSARRAQTVAEHLINYYGIRSDRLVPVGYGSTALADASFVNSPLNTRIEFINVLQQ